MGEFDKAAARERCEATVAADDLTPCELCGGTLQATHRPEHDGATGYFYPCPKCLREEATMAGEFDKAAALASVRRAPTHPFAVQLAGALDALDEAHATIERLEKALKATRVQLADRDEATIDTYLSGRRTIESLKAALDGSQATVGDLATRLQLARETIERQRALLLDMPSGQRIHPGRPMREVRLTEEWCARRAALLRDLEAPDGA